jgi:hypothetical protein
MSRGIGALQREIKTLLDRSFRVGLGPLRFADIRAVFVIEDGGDPESDRLDPTHERSLKRALKTLVERGDVLIFDGKGGPGDPRRYVTVESFAADGAIACGRRQSRRAGQGRPKSRAAPPLSHKPDAARRPPAGGVPRLARLLGDEGLRAVARRSPPVQPRSIGPNRPVNLPSPIASVACIRDLAAGPKPNSQANLYMSAAASRAI